MENAQKINELEIRLKQLQSDHLLTNKKLNQIQSELNVLKSSVLAEPKTDYSTSLFGASNSVPSPEPVKSKPIEKVMITVDEEPRQQSKSNQKSNKSIEEFIGGNLINKIGVLIVVVGVVIGAKYAIDKNMISEVLRICLGYFVGISLLGIGIYLKKKYEDFSAVLVSGSIAVCYIMTFLAYDLYGKIPQSASFAIMVLLTCFTVLTAIIYKRQVIAIIGLVGAYAIPFLLSDGSGNVLFLFSYLAIINTGILVISFKQNWKLCFYMAFLFTWIIYIPWYFAKADITEHISLMTFFPAIFFIQFYGCVLSYKLVKNEQFKVVDLILIILNAMAFFLMGLITIEDASREFSVNEEYKRLYLTAFTTLNALINFSITLYIRNKKLADKTLFYLASALVLTFIAIAAPLQFDGGVVSVFWLVQAVLLYFFSVKRKINVFTYFAYPLMLLSLISLVEDWASFNFTDRAAFLNYRFAESMTFVLGFSLMFYWTNSSVKDSEIKKSQGIVLHLLAGAFAGLLVFGVGVEFHDYFDALYSNSLITIKEEYETYFYNRFYKVLSTLVPIMFAVFVLSVSIVVEHFKEKSINFDPLFKLKDVVLVVVLMLSALGLCNEIKWISMDETIVNYYGINYWALNSRYLVYALVLPQVYFWKNWKIEQVADLSKAIFVLRHLMFLGMLSFEAIYLSDLLELSFLHKLILSIVYGLYAGSLIFYGILKKSKISRILGMIFIGITIVKLFLYDMSNMGTISKTVAAIVLGVILLIVSFLYNKYKATLFNDDSIEE